MQEQRTQPNSPPTVELSIPKIILLSAVILLGISFLFSFTIIGPYLALAGVAFAVAAISYLCFYLIGYHRKRKELDRIEIRRARALAEREEIYNQQERARALSLIQPGRDGNYPIWIDADGQAHAFKPGNIVQPVPHTFSPHIDYRLSGPAGQQITPADVPAIAAPLQLPGPVSMIEVMRHWDLTPEHLFLALGKGNKSLACSIEEFMHVAHDGPTGSGKTWQWKSELIMLLKADILCFLANPHFAPVTRKGEDWRPIGRALEAQELPGQLPGLLYTFEQIRDFLRWLSEVEIDRRFDLQRAGHFTYMPLYGFIDEWAAQVSKYPVCGEYMQDIIRRGRAVDVCVSTNSQGFLIADIGMSGASRENFQTAYHLGGSVSSAAALLDMRQQDITKLLAAEQVALGKGVALLRNNAVSDPAQLVRLPLADNEYVYHMLGRADNWRLPEHRIVSEVVSSDPGQDEIDMPALETIAAASGEQPGDYPNVSRNEMPASSNQRAVNVSGEMKRMIQRLINTTSLSWSAIAEQVGMSGEKYSTFRAVVAELGYDTSIRRGGRKGGQ